MSQARRRASTLFETQTDYSWVARLCDLKQCATLVVHLAGQLVGVFTVAGLGALEMRVTSPLPLNTQPVAGTIAIGWGLGFAACVLR